MPRLQRADVVDRLRKWMSVKGPGSIDTIAPEIMPVVVVASLLDTEEGGASRSAIGGVARSASAGNKWHGQLWNPTDSGIIVLVRHIECSSDTAQQLSVRAYRTACTTLSTARLYKDDLDDTTAFDKTPVAEIRDQAAAAGLGTAIGYAYRSIGTPFEIRNCGFRLREGDGLVLGSGTVNTAFYATFEWVEIPVR